MSQRVLKFRAWADNDMCDNLDSVNLEMVNKRVISFDGNETFVKAIYMQFTGLHDKNGKEIWEGDIIKLANKGPILGEVRFCTPCFIMTLDNMETFSTFNPYHTFMLEVIGNIYENPELLK